MCMLSTLWKQYEDGILDGKQSHSGMYPGVGQNSAIAHWGQEGSLDHTMA